MRLLLQLFANLPSQPSWLSSERLLCFAVVYLLSISSGLEANRLDLDFNCVAPQLDEVVVTPALCSQSNGTAEVRTIAPTNGFNYTWSPNVGIPNAVGNIRTQLPAGTYNVTITDINDPQCNTETTFTIGNSDGPQINFAVTTPASCGSFDGTANITPITFTYNWSDGGTGSTRASLPAGSYQVTVTEAGNSCQNIITVVVNELNPLTTSVAITPPSCNQNNGTVTLTVNGGSGDYTYSWGAGPTQTNLAPSAYSVTITDNQSSCQDEVQFVLTDPTAGATININTPVVNLLCNGDGNGTVDFTVDLEPDFVLPETRTIHDNNGNTVSNGNLSAGNYCITIRDGNDCSVASECFIVSEPTAINATATAIDKDCNMQGSINLNVSGGTGAYRFDWVDLPGNNDPQNRSGLDAGTFQVSVFDENNCLQIIDNIQVDDNCIIQTCNEPVITNISTQPSQCGGATGQANISISANPGDYDFVWTPNIGNGSNIRTNLSSSVYQLRIQERQNSNCFTDTTITITSTGGPDPIVITTPARCQNNDGTAQFSLPTLTYQWPDGNNQNQRFDLAAGTYLVTVTDPGTGCTSVKTVEVDQVNDLDVSFSINQSPGCNQSNGSVTIVVNGGSGDYTFSWGPSETRTDLAAGNYTVTVDDNQSGCQGTVTFDLVENTIGVDMTIEPTVSLDCFGDSDGEAIFTITPRPGFNGTPIVVIEDSNNNTFINGRLPAGDYCVLVRDGAGCLVERSCFQVIEPTAISAQSTIQAKTCTVDGEINIQVSGGTGPYTFDWADLPGGNDPQNRTSLNAGFYQLTITDANNCESILDNLVVTDDCIQAGCANPVVTNIISIQAACAEANGSIVVDVSGNLSDYTFSWTGGVSTTNSASDLTAGIYEVTIADLSDPSCFTIETISVGNIDGPQVQILSRTPATCSSSNGSASLSPANFQYVWCNGGTGAAQNNLASGTCLVSVTDPSTGCTNIINVVIEETNPLDLDVSIDAEATCGQSDGAATIRNFGGSASTTYAWSDNGQGRIRTDLSAGIYEVTATDNTTGCEATITLVMTEQVAANAFINFSDPDAEYAVSCVGDSNAFVVFTPGFDPGFVQPFDLVIVDGLGNEQTNGRLAPGSYCIIIRDGTGCIAGQGCFTVTEPEPLSINVLVEAETCADSGSIEVVVDGGSGSYLFNWGDLPGFDNPEDRTGVLAGTYSLTITDVSGCSASVDGLVVDNDCNNNTCILPGIENIRTIKSNCGEATGSAEISLLNNGVNYTFSWPGNPSTNNIATDLVAGRYAVTIADVNNPSCFTTQDIVIGNADGPQATIISQTPATCLQDNGTAVISPVIYTYEWSNNFTGFNNNSLPAGISYVTITDPSTGCFDIQSLDIEAISPLNAAVNIMQSPDCQSANGIVNIGVTGGSANYIYEWSDNGSGAAMRDDLSSGIYTVTITDQGATGCQEILTFTLTDQLAAIAQVTINNAINDTIEISCVGAADAIVDFDVVPEPGFVQPLTTTILDGNGNIITPTNLSPGDYCIVVSNGDGCIAGQKCFTVIEPEALSVDVSITDFTCTEEGSIKLEVQGGSGNYSYNWEDLIGTLNPGDRTDLDPGTYNVLISDAKDCRILFTGLMVDDSCAICPILDTNSITLVINESQVNCVRLEDCFDAATTTYELIDGQLNGSSSFGDWTLDTDGCLTYNAAANAGTGVDTVCVVASSNGLLDTTCYVVNILSMPPPTLATDTIFLTTNEGIAVDTCLTTAALPNDFAGSQISFLPLNGTGTLTIDPLDSCLTYTPNPGVSGNFVDTMGVILCDVNNVCDTFIVIVSVIPDICPSIFDTSFVALEATDCDLGAAYCLDIELTNIGDFALSMDGQAYTGSFGFCNTDTVLQAALSSLLIQIPSGPYILESWVVNNDTFSIASFTTLQELVDSMNVWNPAGSWMLNGDVITGVNTGDVYGDLIIVAAAAPIRVPVAIQPILISQGAEITVDTGLHILVVNEIATGCQDTITFDVTCNECPDIYDGPNILNLTDCDSLTTLCLSIDLRRVSDFVFEDNGLPFSGPTVACLSERQTLYDASAIQTPDVYEITEWVVNGDTLSRARFSTLAELVDILNTFDPSGNWRLIGNSIIGGVDGVSYGDILIRNGSDNFVLQAEDFDVNGNLGLGLDLGAHQLVITDTTTGCVDTLDITVRCIEIGDIDLRDTIMLGFRDTICLDTMGLMGAIDTIYNECDFLSGTNVSFEPIEKSNCVIITGLSTGADTACIKICNALGSCITINWIVEAIPAESDTVFRDVMIDEDDRFCIDTSMLAGPIDTFFNYCPGSGGVFVEFTLDSDSLCVTYSGLDIGTDTACLVICDTAGFCDTTILIVNSLEELVDPPIANDDDTVTIIGNVVNVQVLDNDLPNGNIIDIIVISDPIYGDPIVNPDGTITYVPDRNVCGVVDSFEYVLIAEGGRDTAMVTIQILCDEITVFSGFSPNNDGVNDTFVILGIENFPNNRVYVFNRWGNEIFSATGYENAQAWDGTWKGQDLPSGTYFYLIEDGEGRQYSGFVQIHR